ncbi:MAG: hypothetical protein ACRDTE_30970 [Pseudonocardiaceae bacterium]
MTGSSRRSPAALGQLARLVAVLAVLAGLVLLHSPHCTDGMSALPHLAASSGTATTAVCGSSAAMTEAGSRPAQMAHQLPAVCPAAGAAGAVAAAAGTSPGSGGMGGVLAICLAFIVAVLATVAGLWPSWQQVALVAQPYKRTVAIGAVIPRAQSLAELCLWRT